MLYIFLFLPLGSIMAQAANSIQWINPSAGSSYTSGQALEATWTSDRPISNPTFSWCTPDGQCGPPSQPQLVDNEDGTTSAHLMPPDSESAKGMYLQMSDKDGGGIHQSPSFTFTASDKATPLRAASGPGQPLQAETTGNPYQWDSSPTAALTGGERPTAYPTPTDGMYPDPSAAMSMASYGLPTAYPGQQPFANPYAVVNMSTTPLTPGNEQEEKKESNRPNAAVIAVPLSICGVILLASLLFCARSRYTRKAKTDLENANSAPGAPPTDWQAIVKRKAMDAGVEKGSEGGGVTVTERRDDAILPTLGYSRGIDRPRHSSRDPRYDDPPRYQRESRYSRDGGSFSDRRRERDMRDDDARSRSSISSRSATRCITPLPIRENSYRDRYTAAPMLDDSRSRRRCDDYKSRSRYGTKHWDEYDDRHSGKDDYYTTSRRSRSGLGGIDDRDRCDCPPRLHSHSLLSAHNSRSRDCSDCHRSIPSTRHIRSHHSSRSSTIDPFSEMPGPTYEPMIRTATTSTASRRYDDDVVVPKKQNKMRRAESSASTITEAGWELAGKGAYVTGHDRGMGELYESLRRAIGEAEPLPKK